MFIRSASHFQKTKLYEIGGVCKEMVVCAYCGDPATQVEHLTPKSFVDSISDLGFEKKRLLLYPACRSCNHICGAKVFFRLRDKARYIAERLTKRFSRLLKIPDWNDTELSRISINLASHVVRGLNKKKALKRRIRWAKIHACIARQTEKEDPDEKYYVSRSIKRYLTSNTRDAHPTQGIDFEIPSKPHKDA